MKRLLIVGAGGHGRVAADIASHCGYRDIAYLDDAPRDGVIGTVADASQYIASADFFVAIGNNLTRECIQRELEAMGATVVTLIHPSAVIAGGVTVGRGTMVAAGAIICVDVTVGDGVIVNTAASVDHDCTVGDFAHVSVGSHVCGTVHVGARTWIGAGATVINNVNITNDCMIGAGAVVVKDITLSGIYVGVPAKRIGTK